MVTYSSTKLFVVIQYGSFIIQSKCLLYLVHLERGQFCLARVLSKTKEMVSPYCTTLLVHNLFKSPECIYRRLGTTIL